MFTNETVGNYFKSRLSSSRFLSSNLRSKIHTVYNSTKSFKLQISLYNYYNQMTEGILPVNIVILMYYSRRQAGVFSSNQERVRTGDFAF